MSKPKEPSHTIRRIEADDPACGFRSGVRPLDDYFARHALTNEQQGIGRTYVLAASAKDIGQGLPVVLGFYTLSMASVESSHLSASSKKKLPRYPLPVALVGRLAVDERARGRRLGETLLIDALRRVVDASAGIGCYRLHSLHE